MSEVSMSQLPPPNSPPRFNVVNGMLAPRIVTQEQVDGIRSMVKLRPDDVWVVSYPKADTTWTQQIVKLILINGVDDGKKLSESVPWIEALNTDERFYYQLPTPLEDMPSPRAFKSHFRYDNMPCGVPHTTPCKYIYVARNCKDVAVSYYHHFKGFKYIAGGPTWDDFIQWFVNGDVPFGDYFDHVLSWWAHHTDDNVLFLKYEDMKADLPLVIAQIAGFIGQDIDQKVIDSVAKQTTFKAMQGNPGANYAWATHRRDPTAPPFMRKGEVGDWMNYFTPGQLAQLDVKISQRLKGTGLDFKYHDCEK